jgi:poly(hydroxyalkanoate) granule-associated protein
MPRKSKQAPKEGVNNQLAEAIRDSATRIWLAGVGAFAAAQKQGAGVFESLVEEGERVQKQIRNAAEDTYSGVATKASQAWDQLSPAQLGRLFEDSVARALHALSIPTKEEVEKLSHRVAELTKVTKTLLEDAEASGGKRHPRARSASKRS